MYFLNYFFIYSLFGHILESCFYFIINSQEKSGYLYGPWTPVYGFGVVLIILISDFVFKYIKKNKIIQSIIIFLWVSVGLSVIEWAGGMTIQYIFHYVFWDYSELKLHIGKYIAVEISLIWGCLAILFIYLLKPITDKLVGFIPKWFTYTIILLFIFDNIFTILNYVK